jgi:urocanate hydratase
MMRAHNRVTAARGPDLRCKGWRQEAILRLLENNLENAEDQDALVVYMSIAKAARDWDSFRLIVSALTRLEDGETLVMQSGKPIGVFRTRTNGPLVVMANGNLVGRWSSDDHLERLTAQGLTIYPGMTAAAWQYIGSQGILQGTYETFMACARTHFGSTLAGRWIVTGGCGGMGGAQPLAGQLAGAATLVIDVDAEKISRRVETGYCQQLVTDLDQALAMCLDAKSARKSLSVGLVGNCAEILPELVRRNITPDIVTDQTSTEPLMGYVPVGLSLPETEILRRADPETVKKRALASMHAHMDAMLAFQRRGSIVFEYGNNLRTRAELGGCNSAFDAKSFIELFIRPLFCQGIGPFRWIAVSGEPDDIAAIDNIILEEFKENRRICDWIRLAREHVKFQGLPARIGWLGHGERSRLATKVNDAVASGALKGPIAFTRDHLDGGSAAMPFRETGNMRDGSDAIADWPILNALLNGAAGADLIAIHGLADYGNSAGLTIVADGTREAGQRLENTLNCDTGMGILRHADAGYETALDARTRLHLGLYRDQDG